MKLKSIVALSALCGIFAAGIYGCEKDSATVNQNPSAVNCANFNKAGEATILPCAEPSVYPLFAGNPENNPEDKQIGTIKIFRDENFLYVQYSVTKEGWTLKSTKTFAGPCDEVPSNTGGAIPGQFGQTEWGKASDQPDCGVTCWIEQFPIESFEGLDCICILTHAEAWNECEPAETAWGGGDDFPGSNWGRYVNCFEIPSCEEANN